MSGGSLQHGSHGGGGGAGGGGALANTRQVLPCALWGCPPIEGGHLAPQDVLWGPLCTGSAESPSPSLSRQLLTPQAHPRLPSQHLPNQGTWPTSAPTTPGPSAGSSRGRGDVSVTYLAAGHTENSSKCSANKRRGLTAQPLAEGCGPQSLRSTGTDRKGDGEPFGPVRRLWARVSLPLSGPQATPAEAPPGTLACILLGISGPSRE